MLEVGTHCFYCRQLDFLPFHCGLCNNDFCAKHRLKEDHHCTALTETVVDDNTSHDNGERFFKSLLPERSHVRVQQTVQKQPTIKSTLDKPSLDKLLAFFKRKKSTALLKKKPMNKIVQLANAKKTAIGDSKIPTQNRIYLIVTVIDDTVSKDNACVFVNKIWPVGRVLDSIAVQLNIKNNNIRFDTTNKEKLFIYKFSSVDNTLNQLNTSNRAIDVFKDLDNVYIIRGSENI